MKIEIKNNNGIRIKGLFQDENKILRFDQSDGTLIENMKNMIMFFQEHDMDFLLKNIIAAFPGGIINAKKGIYEI